MSEDDGDFSMSTLSLHSSGSQSTEDWDRSLSLDGSPAASPRTTTPRNSVIFPAADDGPTPGRSAPQQSGEPGKRSLSELMRLHAEKGTDSNLSAEEAARVAEVLRDWINASSSPYEDEDDFFARGSQDDLSIPSKSAHPPEGRARGKSDSSSSHSRPPSAAGAAKS
ncbi:hypothetical protein C8J57DRAFT_1192043 [Mycena rebaudengoi]|nr:hypothetical protein C8J57DRAFT_1192043 [Mycena rebaudengoi]